MGLLHNGIKLWIAAFPQISYEAAPFRTAAAAAAESLQSCPTLCNPIDGSPPGSATAGILQARTLEWVAISFSNAWRWKVKVKWLSCVWLFETPGTAVYQTPLSMGFSRQEYWSGVPLLSPLLELDNSKGEQNSQDNEGKKSVFSLYFIRGDLPVWCHVKITQSTKGMCSSMKIFCLFLSTSLMSYAYNWFCIYSMLAEKKVEIPFSSCYECHYGCLLVSMCRSSCRVLTDRIAELYR